MLCLSWSRRSHFFAYASTPQEQQEDAQEAFLKSSIGDGLNDESFQRHLGDGDGGIGPYVYSKMATIVPDPLLSFGISEEEKQKRHQALEEKFGRWHFWDGEEDIRPSRDDYCADAKYRDLHGDFFPDDAWQIDAVFVNHILNDGEKVVARAMEAMFSDFGRGKPLPPEGYAKRSEMFRMEQVDLMTTTTPPEDYIPKTGQRSRGGWTTKRSYNGLVRRLLHAMMSNDEFVVVLGGDATAAGHGNHFRQSYLMQFHRILSPIMARMGVKLVTRNMAMGQHGLGTIQSSLGFSSLYGQDIDVLIWDGELTEPNAAYADLFFRQGLQSSGKQGKIPFLLLGSNSNPEGLFELLRFYHNEADIDVGQLGTAMFSVPITTDAQQAQTLPDGFRFLICADDITKFCIEQKHCFHCWIDRTDIPNPKELFPYLEMDENTGSNGGETIPVWYPGWRQHQLMGRNLAYFFLDALQDGIEQWSDGTMGGPPLEDDKWHVTDMYDNMRNKLASALSQADNLPSQNCPALAADLGLPPRICRVPLFGATQHTPRPNAAASLTSLVNLEIGAANYNELIPKNPKTMQYEGQDVHNQCFDTSGLVAEVVSLRRRQLKQEGQGEKTREEDRYDSVESYPLDQQQIQPSLLADGENVGFISDGEIDSAMPLVFQQIQHARIENILKQQRLTSANATRAARLLSGNHEQGKGWAIHGEKPGQCDGQYLSICGRDSSDPCPLLGFHDSRGEIVGNDACGWLVLNLPNLKEGIIMINYAFYNVNHERNLRRSRESRQLNAAIPDDSKFAFVFSIDGGEETSWNKQDLLDRSKTHQHKRLETLVLLDNAGFTSSESRSVQVAIKVNGCGGNSCIFALSHIYWA
ncbi:hypothetical protein ACA910_015965 [Epithemia clementina (nom. ined.)]